MQRCEAQGAVAVVDVGVELQQDPGRVQVAIHGTLPITGALDVTNVDLMLFVVTAFSSTTVVECSV